MDWGNVVIVRHAYREGGTIKNIDSLYGHLDSTLVQRGHRLVRGQEIATMGTVHGLYDGHLHLEIRKNITIRMSRLHLRAVSAITTIQASSSTRTGICKTAAARTGWR